MPVLKFTTGMYKATVYDKAADVYCFKNIRFGRNPVGDLRFAKPAKPEYNATVSDGSYGPECIQSDLDIGSLIGKRQAAAPLTEDCLFLDLYVPGKQLKAGAAKVPVLNWIYGGAYVFGSKDTYSGLAYIKAAKDNLVYVAGNYRLGGFGFAAGKTMEKDGQPNAGLYDQRAVLEWIQDNIETVAGNKADVTVMGESAGAGSIEHHLVAFGGKQEPLFNKAILQSPAFQPLYDRAGLSEKTYKQFESAAGCAGQGLACLRKAPLQKLLQGNEAVTKGAPAGTFGFGPAADGVWVRQVPNLEFQSGNFYKKLDSLIVSHVRDEAAMFASPKLKTDDDFDAYIPQVVTTNNNFILNDVKNKYPRTDAAGSPFKTVKERVTKFISDSSFACNVRFIANAYSDLTKVHVMQYSRGVGLHGMDVTNNIYVPGRNAQLDMLLGTPLLSGVVGPNFQTFAPSYQSYMASFVASGDPNAARLQTGNMATIQWPAVTDASKPDLLPNVLDAGDMGFKLIEDPLIPMSSCGFWDNSLAAATAVQGIFLS
ncbi:alpha/beta-hydrolase [Aulographum hederae CBS 113979]|uniref:Alpha/beta-hydrolase n=1 Tax=Aulographum hederae CBS 113979 TaxID=1176131 RepID=A0A6G1H9R4_9PEZI|nr:alpha/beta-hydrolase [Aulographum hederae CBS 113979]